MKLEELEARIKVLLEFLDRRDQSDQKHIDNGPELCAMASRISMEERRSIRRILGVK